MADESENAATQIRQLRETLAEKDIEVEALRKLGQVIGSGFDTERMLDTVADIIVQGSAEVAMAVSGLRRRSEFEQILERCVEINRLENMADRVYRAAIGELFSDTADIAQVIKWREIYEHMESATDRCEDVANVLEGVALKHA